MTIEDFMQTETTAPRDLLRFELVQRRQSGYGVDDLAGPAEAALADQQSSDHHLLGIYHDLLRTERADGWRYAEPESLEAIEAALPVAAPEAPVAVEDLDDRVHGAWLGRVVGCTLGKAVEWGDHWTPAHIEDYLTLAGAFPLEDYIPVLDPVPARFDLHHSWPEATLGNIDGAPRDDDIDFTVLALLLLEEHGDGLRPEHVADAWLSRLPYLMTNTAERATYRNLVNLVPVDAAGAVDNPYREWIGAQIRSDAFGYVHPGRPRRAAFLAYQDASLSHRANGVYGAMWAAALVAAAFTAPDAATALGTALRHVPPGSRLHEAVSEVMADHQRGITWEQARALIGERHGGYSWVHSVNNACVVAAGLLWADGDFSRMLSLTVMGGLDTDSNGATVGSVAGILAGRRAIPRHWSDPLDDRIRSAIAGFDGIRISTLAERTLRIARTHRWDR